MLEYTGLDALISTMNGTVTEKHVATLLCDDLAEGVLTIYPGPLPDDFAIEPTPNPLVILKILADTLPSYEESSKKIALKLSGSVVQEERPVWFRLQGKTVAMNGRCSIVANCCGSDLRLPKDLLQRIGETVKLAYGVDVRKVLKELVGY